MAVLGFPSPRIRDRIGKPNSGALALKEEDIIGQGCYATVFRLNYKGTTCTAKKLHPIFYREDEQATIRKFKDECALLGALRHPNIVRFVETVTEEGSGRPVMLTEWLPTDLEHAMDQHGHDAPIPLSVKLSLLQDVSYGLLYLHSMKPDPIVHRDLTAANVLVTRDLRAKIADLGVSKVLDISPQKMAAMTKCPGALAYMPPEALTDKPEYGTPLDIFSFGHLSLFLVNQEFPYTLADTGVTWKKGTVQYKKREKAFGKMGKNHCLCLKELLERCLHDFPKERPTAVQLSEELYILCSAHPKRFPEVVSVCCRLYKHWGFEGDVELEKEQAANKSLSAEVENLKAELERVKGENEVAVFKAQADTFKQDFDEERKQRAEAHGLLDEEKGKNKTLLQSLDYYKKSLAMEKKETQELRKERTKLRQDLESTKRQLEAAKAGKGFFWRLRSKTSSTSDSKEEGQDIELPNRRSASLISDMTSGSSQSLPNSPRGEGLTGLIEYSSNGNDKGSKSDGGGRGGGRCYGNTDESNSDSETHESSPLMMTIKQEEGGGGGGKGEDPVISVGNNGACGVSTSVSTTTRDGSRRSGFEPDSGLGFGPGSGLGFGPGSGLGFGPGSGLGFGPGSGLGFGPGGGTAGFVPEGPVLDSHRMSDDPPPISFNTAHKENFDSVKRFGKEVFDEVFSKNNQ